MRVVPLLALWGACSTPEKTAPEPELDRAAESDTDSDTDADTDTDTDSDTDSDTGPDTGTDPEPSFVQAFAPDRARTDGNPLTGFFTSYQWAEPVVEHPASLEYVVVPLADLMDGPASFTFDEGLEPLLVAAEARGHQVVLRPYIDYPAQPSGLPAYLEALVEQWDYTEHGGGQSPDYADPELRAALQSFIAALGARYDGDPRLGVVQLGLLGFWGEWHTWPHSAWFPDVSIQNEVLHAYHDAFSTTLLQVRIPTGDSPALRMGFHDDSFAYSTVGAVDWFFLPQLEAAGAGDRWKEVPIGGELRPELQGIIFDEDYEEGEYQQGFDSCVSAVHPSFLLNYQAFSGTYDPQEQERAHEAARTLGYAYHLSRAELASGELTVEVENLGVAPFYPPLELSVTDPSGVRVAQPLPRVLPGEVERVSLSVEALARPGESAPWTVALDSDAVLPSAVIRWATQPEPGVLVLP